MDLVAEKLDQYFLNIIAVGEVDGKKCLNLRSLSMITLEQQ